MKIYWGGADSGKGHLVKYAKLNSKTFVQFKDYQIIKQYTTCKDYDYDINDRLWWHIVENFYIYHKRKDEENVRVSNFTKDQLLPLYHNNTVNNYSNPYYGKESDMRWDNRLLLKPEQFRKYLGREYIDTTIYNDILFTPKVGHTLDRIVDHKDKFSMPEHDLFSFNMLKTFRTCRTGGGPRFASPPTSQPVTSLPSTQAAPKVQTT